MKWLANGSFFFAYEFGLQHKFLEKSDKGASKMLPKIKKARQIRAAMDAEAQKRLAETESSPISV